MCGLDELRKDPSTRVPAELYDPNKLGSGVMACQCRKNSTYRDEYVQQGQVETRRPNRVYQRKDLPSGNEKACRRSTSGGL